MVRVEGHIIIQTTFLNSANLSSTFQLYLYNQDTCTEFHDLLISLLVGYAKALHKPCELHSCGNNVTISNIHPAWFVSCLLWEVIESVAYKMHLNTLQSCLSMVSYSSLGDYRTFAGFVGLSFHDATGMHEKVLDNHPDDLMFEPGTTDAKWNPMATVLKPAKLNL
jgi:hypothetical protein